MAISELERQRLYERLRAVLGEREAATMMSLVPAGGWDDVARRSDLDTLEHRLRAEIAELRAELKTDIAGVRTEISELRAELKTDIADVRTEIGELRGEMGSKLLTLFLGMIGLQISAATLVVAVSRFV